MSNAAFVLPPPPPDFEPTPVAPAEGWLDGMISHFSASSLRQLKICPEQYRQRYILGRKERPGEALTLGKAVHEALEHSWRQKIESHEDLPLPEVIEYFHDAAWPKSVEMDGGVEEIRWDLKPEEVRNDGQRVTQAYHTLVSPRVQPVKVESRFDYVVAGVPVPLIGYLDVEEADNNVDLKTGKQVQRKPDANWRLQGTIYTSWTGKPTHFHSASRAKTPSLATPKESPEMMVMPDPRQKEQIERIIRDFAAQVEWYFTRWGPDVPWPTTGAFMDYKGGPACNYCGFRKFCVFWEHERTPVIA